MPGVEALDKVHLALHGDLVCRRGDLDVAHPVVLPGDPGEVVSWDLALIDATFKRGRFGVVVSMSMDL